MNKVIEALGADRVNTGELECYLHSKDLAPVPDLVASAYNHTPQAVLKPTTEDELVALIKAAGEEGIPLIPKGRGTSYLWGSVPVTGGAVVDMVEFRDRLEVDEDNMTVAVSCGRTWEEVEVELRSRELALRVYPTSMPSATIGGWVASAGAGIGVGGHGVGSYMYGPLADNITAMRVVNGSGEILSLNGREEVADFVGVDGALGIISEVTLNIRSIPESEKRLLITIPDNDTLHKCVLGLGGMDTVYFGHFEDKGLLDLKATLGLDVPKIDKGYVMFLELEGDAESVAKELKQINEMIADNSCNLLTEKEADLEWEERCYPMRVKRVGPTVVAGEFLVPANFLLKAITNAQGEMPDNAKSGLHGVLVGPPDVILMPQVFSDERRGFGFLAALSYSKRFNDIGPRHGGKPYGVGHMNAFAAKAVHGEGGFARLSALKDKHDPNGIINPSKGLKHLTKFGIPLPSIAFSLTMWALGLFRRSGV